MGKVLKSHHSAAVETGTLKRKLRELLGNYQEDGICVQESGLYLKEVPD